MPNPTDFQSSALATLRIEQQALDVLATQIGDSFNRACEILLQCKGRVVITGMGKSGHIGRKMAATFASTGTPSFFMHPGEAGHGDLGMLVRGDVLIAISNSGKSDEIMMLMPLIKHLGVPLITISRDDKGPMPQNADIALTLGESDEACPLGLAPTSSTTATLVLGDALAVALLEARGFTADDFARSHPAGALGARLLNKVHHLMRTNEAIPQVKLNTSVMDAMLELSRTGLGLVAVCDDDNQVKGVFTDGDLRRWLVGGGKLDVNVSSAMTTGGLTLNAESRAIEAKELLMKRKITAAPVVDEAGRLCGAINLQDFYQAGIL